MPPRFDRDIPNIIHSVGSHQANQQMNNGTSNGMCATNGNGNNNNNPLLNGLNNNNVNVGSNGGIGSNGANAVSLRKPLLEINGTY
jgi:hypothetical protein